MRRPTPRGNDYSMDPVGMRAEFRSLGFTGPVPILSKHECGELLGRLRESDDPPVWFKGHGASSPAFLAAAQHPRLLGALSVLLGPDVMLWGASLVTREPGQSHRWHTDIESSDPSSRTVSVWLGLDGTSRRSSLQVASGSHRFGRPLQEVYARAGKRRGDVTRDDVLEWALEHDPRSGIVEPDLQDGDALFFDGRLWHGSRNTDEERTRTCLLLQYATPGTPIRIPDLTALEWPFRPREDVMPPCVLVTGNAEDTPNDLVAASAAAATGAAAGPLLRNRVDRLGLPLPEDDIVGWKPHLAFKGATRGLDLLTCHTSVLSPGVTPHDIHTHVEEEILIVLAGDAEILTLDNGEGVSRRRMTRGDVAYYPAFYPHTIDNPGPRPATYLMLKWAQSSLTAGVSEMGRAFSPLSPDPAPDRDFACTLRFEGPTRHLRRLHCHQTTLQAGASYEPHEDPYDVVIVTLDGELETIGERVSPNSVIFYAAGNPHGMRNVGRRPARYLVFELHGPAPDTEKTAAGVR